jgi:glycosyltransferase involved in cell wall biosynthesis
LLHERIADAGIQALFIADRIGELRGLNADGKKIYTLFDIYPHADLVTYPSYYEGFGNAFLEAVYFGKPVVVNTYAVYARDIDPLGFKTIEMSMLVTNEVVEKTREILYNRALREEWAAINFDLGVKFFSYSVARRNLQAESPGSSAKRERLVRWRDECRSCSDVSACSRRGPARNAGA